MALPTPRSPPANSHTCPSATCICRHDPHLNPCLLWLVSHWLPLLQGLWAVIPKANLWLTQPPWHRQGSLPGAGRSSVLWATKLRSCLSPSGRLPGITVGGPAQMCPVLLKRAHHHSHTRAGECRFLNHTHTHWMCQQLPLSWPSQCSPGSCPHPAQPWSTTDRLLGWGPLLNPSAALPQHSPCLPHSPFILSYALVVVWKCKGHTFHHELHQILLTLTLCDSKAAAWSQGPGRTTQNVWAALSKS